MSFAAAKEGALKNLPCRYRSTLVLAGGVALTPFGTAYITGTPPMVPFRFY